MKLYCVVLLSFFSFALHANEDTERQEIQLRIQPVGKVSVQNQADTQNVSDNPVVKPGQSTFEQYCTVCHKDGLAGAPKFRNEQDWKPRLADRTIADLLASSIKGLNAMPTKGTCIKCNEDDLKAAISYMLPQS